MKTNKGGGQIKVEDKSMNRISTGAATEITTDDIRSEFEALVRHAFRISEDLGNDVAGILKAGIENPLDKDAAYRLLTTVLEILKRRAQVRGDTVTAEALSEDTSAIVDSAIRARDRVLRSGGYPGFSESLEGQPRNVRLVSRNGIQPRVVHPTPVFMGRMIPMVSGFVKTTDIDLWGENERLDIHIKQFRHQHGRGPTPAELLDIMLSNLQLPGVPKDKKEDQFEIVALARSIAANGLRVPPIIDIDGTLLDGNRRVTACHYILNSDEFSADEKKVVEYVFVWQLTDHATDLDREAVVVSLNFEPDHKEPWPEYVKARKVYEAWQSMLVFGPTSAPAQRVAQMKRELSRKFGLGPDTSVVNRYLKMVEWANEFEEFHRTKNQRDEFEVKHRADHYFQYFDELAKGSGPGGVAHALNQDEGFRGVVFDLLYDGKFKNWRRIRELKHIYENQEARDYLVKARSEPDPDIADEYLENAIATARIKKAEQREVGANTRIETFVKWLEELPVRTFRDQIKPENLRRLLRALQLVEVQAKEVLKDTGART